MILLQIIKFAVCLFNMECGRTHLDYYDGNLRNEHFRYCGLRSLVLPRSKTNVAELQTYDNANAFNVNDLVIRYTTVQAELADLGNG